MISVGRCDGKAIKLRILSLRDSGEREGAVCGIFPLTKNALVFSSGLLWYSLWNCGKLPAIDVIKGDLALLCVGVL